MKRFYKDVSVEQREGGWRILLDGRPIRTAGGKPQVLPTRALAEAMAREWADQGEEIDTSAFIFRDLADYAIDTIAVQRADAIAELVRYAGTDTLCYRGEPGEALFERQTQVWEPLVLRAESRWDIHFTRISGIIHQPQPSGTMARMEAVLTTQSDFALASLRMLTSLSASLLIALTALEPDAEPAALWSAANLEEDWQAELWGQDAEAQARRETRFKAFRAAMEFAALASDA